MGACIGKSKVSSRAKKKRGVRHSADKELVALPYQESNEESPQKISRQGVLEASKKFDINYTVIPNKIHRTVTIRDDLVFGLVGLRNLGNTCFMNSALQCLLNTGPLTDYFLSDLHTQEINEDNFLGSKGVVTKAYSNLVKAVWENSDVESISPSEFYETFGEFAIQFSQGTQEDAHDFLACLLDVIHEDLNRVKQRPIINEKEEKGKSIEKQAAEAWMNHLMRNRSIIVDLFQGQIKSSLKCHECGFVSHKFEPFMYLSLPIPEEKSKKSTSLYDCIEEFLKEEKLEKEEKWRCPKCKDFKDSSKKIDIWTLPNILIIHLKRFMFTRHKRGKIRTMINFPIEDLDLTKYLASKPRDKPLYDLFAISNHEGHLGGGHYTSYVKNRDDGSWYCMNDSYVRTVDFETEKLVDSSAYVLFYSKTSVDEFYRQTITNPEAWPHFHESMGEIDHSLVVLETPVLTRKATDEMRKLSHRNSRLRASNTSNNFQSLSSITSSNIINQPIPNQLASVNSNRPSIHVTKVTNQTYQVSNISFQSSNGSPGNIERYSEGGLISRKSSSTITENTAPLQKTKKIKQSVIVIPKENMLPNKGIIKLQRTGTSDNIFSGQVFDERNFGDSDFMPPKFRINPNTMTHSKNGVRLSTSKQAPLDKIEDVEEESHKISYFEK